MKHNFESELASISNALTFSETPITEYRSLPLRGENTQGVLAGKLGYDENKIAQLRLCGRFSLAVSSDWSRAGSA
ncbi:hypothetical protein IVA98_13040 [Bradyrhizobium sp. 160]|uniref:hypothetical protein n=1 Tax=Bradyrhizobium sp. 160 TaxID=2782634 RepID=UPI001FF9FA51|nr:hypothetical protein [Bradyrhizobium sp. 160]MCK1624098.1 hypothetical protein [Bradyrhizobium sp. 160]